MNINDLPKIQIEQMAGHDLRDVFVLNTMWDDHYDDGYKEANILVKPEKFEQTIVELLFYSEMLQTHSNKGIHQIMEPYREQLKGLAFEWYYNKRDFSIDTWTSYSMSSLEVKYFDINGLELRHSFDDNLKKKFHSYLWSNFLIPGEFDGDDLNEQFLSIARNIGESIRAVKESQKLEQYIKIDNNEGRSEAKAKGVKI